MVDFQNFDYLKSGNTRQKQAYLELIKLKIFENLEKYNPILTGTIPIAIDIPDSDLDIICECENHNEFSALVSELYEYYKDFEIRTKNYKGIKSTVAKFKTQNFEIEIFGQNIPSNQQNAYKHMLIEAKILNENGTEFKAEIIKLKLDGLKTEPAFAKLLGLTGNPYDELLKIDL